MNKLLKNFGFAFRNIKKKRMSFKIQLGYYFSHRKSKKINPIKSSVI